MAKLAFCLGVFFTALFFIKGNFAPLPLPQKTLLILFLGQILYARIVAIYPWYPPDALGPGIRLQFEKALVPVGYILLVAGIFFGWSSHLVGFILFNLLLLPISVVACILIYFHLKDPDPSCPNLLSGTPREKL